MRNSIDAFAPLGVLGSARERYPLASIFRLMLSTYHPKRLPKFASVRVVGPLATPDVEARGITDPACSPYCARLVGTGGCCTGVFFASWCSGFLVLPWMGIAVSSTSFLALGCGGAGASLGFSVASTFWFGG